MGQTRRCLNCFHQFKCGAFRRPFCTKECKEAYEWRRARNKTKKWFFGIRSPKSEKRVENPVYQTFTYGELI